MSCNRCHKDHCNCGNNVLEATNIAVVPGVSVTITIQPIQQFKDHKIYLLEIPQSLPPMVGIEPVTIVSGEKTYYLLDRFGDIVRGGELRGHHSCDCGNPYRIVFGADGIPVSGSGEHFEFLCNLDCLKYASVPTILNAVSLIPESK